MTQKRILIIEDDPAILRGIADALAFEGYAASSAATGDEGLELANKLDVDLVLLDLILPGCDGFEILRSVRETRPTLPVIILTARGEEADRVKGLELGADDYVVKPFSVKELLARVEAVLRRSPERPTDVRRIEIPGGVVDFERCEVRYEDGTRAELSEREGALLRYLVSNAGRVISREELLARVWRIEPRGVDTRTIDMHVARLREKLRDRSRGGSMVLTVRGKGYLFDAGGASQ